MNASIKQANPHGKAKLGLEKSNLQLFEVTESTYEIPFVNNKWKHGLNEEELKIVENHYGHSFSNPEHYMFWASLTPFKIDHTIRSLDLTNPEDILLCGVLKEMKILAPSIEDSNNKVMANYLFALNIEGEEEELKLSIYQRFDKAIVSLTEVGKQPKYIIALAKYILPPSISINDSTKAYTKLREFLDCTLKTNQNRSKKEALNIFENALEKDKGVLFTTVDFREAKKKNIIRLDSNNRLFNVSSGTVYGKNEEEAISYLLNPKNQDELGADKKGDKNYSIRYQLKQRNA